MGGVSRTSGILSTAFRYSVRWICGGFAVDLRWICGGFAVDVRQACGRFRTDSGLILANLVELPGLMSWGLVVYERGNLVPYTYLSI